MRIQQKRRPIMPLTCSSGDADADEKKRGMSTASTCAFRTALFPLTTGPTHRHFVRKESKAIMAAIKQAYLLPRTSFNAPSSNSLFRRPFAIFTSTDSLFAITPTERTSFSTHNRIARRRRQIDLKKGKVQSRPSHFWFFWENDQPKRTIPWPPLRLTLQELDQSYCLLRAFGAKKRGKKIWVVKKKIWDKLSHRNKLADLSFGTGIAQMRLRNISVVNYTETYSVLPLLTAIAKNHNSIILNAFKKLKRRKHPTRFTPQGQATSNSSSACSSVSGCVGW